MGNRGDSKVSTTILAIWSVSYFSYRVWSDCFYDDHKFQICIFRALLSESKHFIALRQIIHQHYISPLKLHEFFQADIEQEVQKFTSYKGK